MIRIGLVGCGRISEKHISAIIDLKGDCELVAVCERDKERAKSAIALTGAEWYGELEEMLARPDIDVISLCTPSGLHAPQGTLAAQHGKHVITEKPMALDLESADRLIAACEANDTRLFVVKQVRLTPTLQYLRRAIDRGRFGKIYSIFVNVLWQRPQSYYDAEPWRGTWAQDGGAFMNQASHFVDLLSWFGGEVETVTALTATLGRSIEAEDSGVAVMRFKNGIIGSINVSMLTYPKNLETTITVLGEKGTVKAGGASIGRFEKWEFQDYDDDDRIIYESNLEPPAPHASGHYLYYKNVIDVLGGCAEPKTDGHEGRHSVALIRSIYESATSGKPVSFSAK